MLRLLKILFVLISVFLLVSCKKDNTTNPQNNGDMADYMPLNIGNWWKYEQYELDHNGTRQNKHTFTITVTGTSVVEGRQGYDFTFSSTDPDTSFLGAYSVIEDGRLLYYDKSPECQESFKWNIVADINSNQWLLEDTLIVIDTSGINCESYYKWTIHKGGQNEYNVKNNRIQSQEFISEQLIVLKDDIFPRIDSTIFISNDWYGKGVGKVYSYCKITGNVWNEKPWTETILVDYGIK